jgi:hypothetical protein
VSRSSAEAEYRALCVTGCELLFIHKLLGDFQVRSLLPLSLHCDNNAAIFMTANPVFHNRTKHFEIDLFFLREKVMAGVFKLFKIDTLEQPADIFTKNLGASQHHYLCKKLKLENNFSH